MAVVRHGRPCVPYLKLLARAVTVNGMLVVVSPVGPVNIVLKGLECCSGR